MLSKGLLVFDFLVGYSTFWIFFGGRNSVTKNKKDILRSSTGFEAEASNQRLGGSQRKEQQRKTPDALKVKGPKKQKKNKSDLHCMRK